MLLMGGELNNGSCVNDVWRLSVVAPQWVQVQPVGSGWEPRRAFGALALSVRRSWQRLRLELHFTPPATLRRSMMQNDRLVVFGGQGSDGRFFNDMWSSDQQATNWTLAGAGLAVWAPRAFFASVVLKVRHL